jgi:type IV pilus assembly protein PilW
MNEKGIMLVEMMIAMVLGMILIAGIMSVFLGTKQGYRMGQGMVLMQSTGRATLNYLSRELSMTGFPQSSAIETFIPTMTADGGGSNTDQFTVHYRTTANCLGGATPVYADGVQYTKNMYFIQNDALVCRTLAEDDSTLAEAVIDNVVSVRIGILVNSQSNIATSDDEVAYDLQGQTQIAAANDHMRRRAYSATVVVRNRTQGS